LCVATLWIAKRWLRGALPGNNGKGQLRTIESLALTYGCSLHLVQVGKQQVLAGVDRTGFKALLALTEPFEASLNAVQSATTSEMEMPRIVPIGAHIN
jgi:flagellar biogenesis protein FliO